MGKINIINIYICDYTSPGDADSANGIRAALAKALEITAGGRESVAVRFEAGEYRLADPCEVSGGRFRRSSAAGDGLDPGEGEKQSLTEAYVAAVGLKNVTLEGAVDENGMPATTLSGGYDGELNSIQPSILFFRDCLSLTLRNFRIVRSPMFGSAGEVISTDGETLKIRVFEGNPVRGRMGSYCMNRFTRGGDGSWVLTGESLTYGQGGAGCLTREGEDIMALRDPKVASRVEPGDAVSWHDGAKTDFQSYFGGCRGLTLENIRTPNTNGFAMLAFQCRNITAKNISFAPEGKMLFCGPRDAWKLQSCSGNIRIEGMEVEGVRMDGQNMHSTFFFIRRVGRGRGSCVVSTKHHYVPLEDGSEFEIYDGADFTLRRVTRWLFLGEREGKQLYALTFEGGLPEFADVGTMLLARCLAPDSYVCEDSSFRNIAGAGHLSRISNMQIRRCRYENLMNPGILMGAEFTFFHEGGSSRDCVIEDCSFANCGFHPRYGAVGCIAARCAGLDGPYNRRVRIRGCSFADSEVGVHIADAEDVTVENCDYINIADEIVYDDKRF